MKGRTSKTAPVLPHVEEATLPSGKTLTPGREFHVHGATGRFSFRYQYVPDGSITCYGPLTENGHPRARARVRSFPLERISKVHKPKKELLS